MKREYTKPDILFESFSLSTGIAGNCEVKTNLPTVGVCGLQAGPFVLFQSGIVRCTTTKDALISVLPQYDQLCYHNPSEAYNLFRS